MLRRLLELKPRDVPLRVALRNTTAVMLPMLIGVASGHVGAGIGVAVGALNTMFSDQPGPYRLRAQRMLLAACAAGISAFVGTMLGDDVLALTLAALLWGVGGGLLVALGPEAGRAGLTSMVLLVVTAAVAQPITQALGVGLLILVGGVLQTGFALAAWPLQRYRPERHALASVLAQLAAMARARHDATQAPPTTQALSYAQDLLHGAHRARSVAVQSFRVLAEISERVRIELLALGDLREQIADAPASTAVGAVLELAGQILDGISSALTQGAAPAHAQQLVESLDARIEHLADLRDVLPAPAEARLLRIAIRRAQGLAGQLRSLIRNANFAGSRGELRAQSIEARLPAALRPQGALATLRANLTWSSVALRHALRCGICLAFAVAAERLLKLPHGYWFPMTTAIVLKPDYAGTFSFGVLRVIGTLVGLLLVSALVHFAFDGVWERLVILGMLCIGFRLLTTINYAIGTAALTGLIVILLSFEGQPPGSTMLPRAIDTIAGCTLALAAYALWPTRESLRMRPTLASMIDAYRDYLHALLHGSPADWADARAVARAARTNAQASLDRLAGEPRPDRALIALAEGVFANGNRVARACMAFEATLIDGGTIPERDAVGTFAARVEAALKAIATSLREHSPIAFAALRAEERKLSARLDDIAPATDDASSGAAVAHAFDRITDGVDTLAHLIAQMPAERGTPAA